MSYIHLLPSCIITEGYRRALLYDTQSSRSRLLSRELAAALQLFSGRKVQAFHAHLQQLGMAVTDVTAFTDTLSAEGFVLLSPVRIHFDQLTAEFDQPFAVTNVIIDIAAPGLHLLPQMVQCFRSIACPNLQLRICADITPDAAFITSLRAFATTDTLSTVGLLMPFFEGYETLPAMLKPAALTSLVLYNAPGNDILLLHNLTDVVLLAETMNFPACCGIVDAAYFNFSLPHYSEAKHHNSCLNRKISIDQQGYIRNCPSMAAHYGHVNDTDFAKVLKIQAFRQQWRITKDQVSVCRNCEFRYVCTDCRAYLEQPDDLHSKPLKCGYDPYTCTWEDWSTHPAKQAAIACYGL